MKTLLVLSTIAAVLSAAAPSFADTKDYKAICDSRKLSPADKADCKAQFDAAASSAERAAIFKVFDYKIAGFAPDGTRLSKAAPSPAMADAAK
jgi:hypothetical protein